MSERPTTPTDPIATWMLHLQRSLIEGSFVRVTLSSPVVPTLPDRIIGRVVELADGTHLSCTLRHSRRDETKNLPIAAASTWLRDRVGHEFRSALLQTTSRDWQLHASPKGIWRLVAHKAAATKVPTRVHDEASQHLLDPSAADWLAGLGVVDADGRVREKMGDKHRQIQRYTEILNHLVRDLGWQKDDAAPVIVDMGSGKAYLTFSVWQLLRRQMGIKARIIGVEERPELVQTCTALASRIKADGLEFRAGDIASADLPAIDGLIALHACNTATDAAILRGIGSGARLIVVAPCCHKEVRPQLGSPEALAPVLAHGLFKERFAEWVTDGLRTLFLEWAGYKVRVIEFVDAGHTPKNLMLAAVRVSEPFQKTEVRDQIVALKTFAGVAQHALDELLARGEHEPRQ